MSLFTNGIDAINVEKILDARRVKIVDDKFDLNDNFARIKTWGKKPIHSPEFILPWAIYFNITLDNLAKIQIAIDTSANVGIRSFGGNPTVWGQWFQIKTGGVKPSYTTLYATFEEVA